MSTWQQETERYKPRILRLRDPLSCLKDGVAKLPGAPLDFRPSDEGALRYQLCTLVIGALRSSHQLVKSFEILWFAGHFISSSLVVRLLIEIFGQLRYAERKVLQKLNETGDVSTCQARMTKLFLGSKSGVPMPWSPTEIGATIVVNVMDLLREADGTVPGTLDTYAFLCDAAHPTHLQHSYLLFAGPDYDNWTNEVFSPEAHRILDRTLAAAESALESIQRAGLDIFANCLPLILSEQQLNDERGFPT